MAQRVRHARKTVVCENQGRVQPENARNEREEVMDPNLLKKLGMIAFQAPADDLGGGGDDGADDPEAPEDGDDGEDGGDDDESDEPEDGDADEADEPEDEDDGEEADDADLGKRAQKRIGKLVKERNAANAELKRVKGELESARKLAGDDGKVILAAAGRSGILPGLMTKDEAQAFDAIERYPRVIERYQDWLDEHESGDEFGEGDAAMSYGAVKKRVRQLTRELGDLKDEYGARQRELRQKVRKIFELGMKAYRKGAKADEDGETPNKGKKKPKPSAHPHGRKPVAKGGKKSNWGAVDGDDAFVRMIASENEGEE